MSRALSLVLLAFLSSAAIAQYEPLGNPAGPKNTVAFGDPTRDEPTPIRGQDKKPPPKWEGKPGDLSFYAQFLIQAEKALDQDNGAVVAGQILDACPKEVRGFEWHHLYRRAHRESVIFKGHEDDVCSLAFNRDGKILASGSYDRTIVLWDFATGKPLHTLKGHNAGVRCLAFHPDGQTLVSGSSDRSLIFWRVKDGKELNAIPKQESSVAAVAFSPDGKLLAYLSYGRAHVLELAKKNFKRTIDTPDVSVTRLAFSRDGKLLALGTGTGEISLWSLPDLQFVKKLTGHDGSVSGIAFLDDGIRLASAGLDGLRFWNVGEGKMLDAFTNRNETLLTRMASNLEGSCLAMLNNKGEVKLWHEPFNKPTQSVTRTDPDITEFAFHPNGHALAISGGQPPHSVRIHSIIDDIATVKAAEPIWSVYPGNDKFLVTMRKDMALFAAGAGEKGRTLKGHRGQVRAVVLQPQGHLLASAGLDRTIKIWDPTGTREFHSLKGHEALVRSLAFSADGKHLASASDDKTIKIWDAVAGREIRTLRGHKGMVTTVVYLPGGELLASAGGDGTIRLWNLATGKNTATWDAHEDVVSHIVLAPDGKRLASAGTDGKLKIWDIAGGKALHTLDAKGSMVQSLAFSPDGKRLACGAMTGGVTLWDPDLGQPVYTFARSGGPINAVAFSPDGWTLYSGNYDGTVMLWKARPMD